MEGNETPLKVLALVCSLKSSSDPSSSELLASGVIKEMEPYNVSSTVVRVVDHDIKPGVEIDMGGGDEWPAIRQQMMESDILLIATPIWVGHPCSIAQRVVERLDAELSEMDGQGRLLTYGKVGIVAVVGNEDGAHKVSSDMFQALSDVGFTIPAIGSTYWVGEAMHKTDYKDLDHKHRKKPPKPPKASLQTPSIWPGCSNNTHTRQQPKTPVRTGSRIALPIGSCYRADGFLHTAAQAANAGVHLA